MQNKTKVTSEIRIQVVKKYLAGEITMVRIAQKLNVNTSTVEHWVRKFRNFGEDGLLPSNKSYTSETKINAVTDYLNGNGSLNEVCFRYKISSYSVLQHWIKLYNSHNRLKLYKDKENVDMTKGRKTTYRERIEIVAFCIANANDYILTINKYKVSYNQIYGWVRKYNANGYEGLIDKRGKHKEFEELDESQKISTQLKLLEAENRRLRMENDFLKKLKEIERR